MNAKYLLTQWQAGPHIDATGLIVVPLHPTIKRNWYTWEKPLGFLYHDAALVRGVLKPYNGKHYTASAWLTSTWRKFREFYPEWTGQQEFHIAPVLHDPHAAASRFYQVYGGDETAREFWGKGYPPYSLAGAIKNQFGITDRYVRGQLQQIARESYAKIEATA